MRAVQETRAAEGTTQGDQTGVWHEVDECPAGVSVESKTASLTDGFARAEEELQEYRDKLPLPEGSAEVIVGEGDQIVGMDVFDSPEILAPIWLRLLGAYFFDALRNRRRQTRTSRLLAKSRRLDLHQYDPGHQPGACRPSLLVR